MKKLFMWLATLLLPVLFLVVAVEIYGRVTSAHIYQYDDKLGWKLVPDLVHHKMLKDISGRSYSVEFDTDRNGFREWGDLDSLNKIFFVGDSYTADPNSSDIDSYFNIVKHELGAEVFATGGGGYGTLQELMLVEEFIDIIKPDVFILQFCENDFVNNGYELEGLRFVRNQKNFRPYLVNDKIIYRDAGLYRTMIKYSKIASKIDTTIQQFQYKKHGDYSPRAESPEEIRKENEALTSAVNVTEELLSRMHHLVSRYTNNIFTINCNNSEQWRREKEYWLEISEKTGFEPLPMVTMKIDEHENRGVIVRVKAGGHWNIEGNQIAGEELARLLRERITFQ